MNLSALIRSDGGLAGCTAGPGFRRAVPLWVTGEEATAPAGPEQFLGQKAAHLPCAEHLLFGVDKWVLNTCLRYWRQRFVAGRKQWKSRALFRSLQIACQAARMPAVGSQCLSACVYMTVVLCGLIDGRTRGEVLDPEWEPMRRARGITPFHTEIAEVAEGSFRRKSPPQIVGSGYVVKSLEAALWGHAHPCSRPRPPPGGHWRECGSAPLRAGGERSHGPDVWHGRNRETRPLCSSAGPCRGSPASR